MNCHNEQLVAAFWTAALGLAISVDQPGDLMVLRDAEGNECCLSRPPWEPCSDQR